MGLMGWRGTDPAKYAEHLQKLHPEELGFLPRIALQEYSDRGQIIPATDNGDWCGYALFYDGRNGKLPRRHPRTLKIHQICVAYDVRRIEHATRLIRQIILRARLAGMLTIDAWVACDIDANHFWRAMDFECIDTRIGGRKRNRIHNLWRYRIPAVHPIIIEPGHDRSTFEQRNAVSH